jgi:tetratricopeptide (TPR) repeat protein
LKPDSSIEYSTKNLNHTKEFQHILSIYTRLVQARGDFRYPIPALFLREEEAYVASINYSDLAITIEKKAYDVCRKFGDIGLAFLLAHELTHYYEKHAWKSDFTQELSGLDVTTNLKSIEDQVLNETQADYLGGFLAYSAGFGLFDKSSEVIDSLYAAYKRPEKLMGYPSKTDRIKMAEKSAQKVMQMAEIFDVANYMVAVGQYDSAIQLYKHLLMQYQSREIYNNIGHVAVLQALTYFNKDSLKYQYAPEIDLNFMGSRSGKSIRDSLLRLAIQYFDTAVSMDPDYAPGYLNKANAYALLQEDDKAMFYLENEAVPALKRASQKYLGTETDIYNLRGILQAKSGQKAKAMASFDVAIKAKSSAAIFNKNVLSNIPNPTKSAAPAWHFLKDSIGSTSLESYFKAPTHIPKKEVMLNSTTSLRQAGGKKDYKIYNYTTGKELKVSTVFLTMVDGFAGKTKFGIEKGSKIESLHKSYGQPETTIHTTQGRLMVYDGEKISQGKLLDDNKIIFVLDNNVEVTKWIYFSSKLINK